MNTPSALRFPNSSLADAMKYGELLYKNAGRTPVDYGVAAKAMGYTSTSGAARATMASLSSYGVISKIGGLYRISDEFLKYLRPINEADKDAALRFMALRPQLFRAIHSAHRECSEPVLMSLLIHQGLVEDSAKKAAKLYKTNSAFAKLEDENYHPESESNTDNSTDFDAPFAEAVNERKTPDRSPQASPASIPARNVLAQYSIPLGGNEATLVFTGETLVPDDFDALAEYVLLFKKQFERRQKIGLPSTDPIASSEEAHPQ